MKQSRQYEAKSGGGHYNTDRRRQPAVIHYGNRTGHFQGKKEQADKKGRFPDYQQNRVYGALADEIFYSDHRINLVRQNGPQITSVLHWFQDRRLYPRGAGRSFPADEWNSHFLLL